MIEIFEVGPRDGLQNESFILSTPHKIQWIEKLQKAGIRRMEIGSFVRPDFVPQMADTDQLYLKLKKNKKSEFWGLVPNLKGLERAKKSGATHIALFTAVSEKFTEKNTGMSLKKSFKVMNEIMTDFKKTPTRTPLKVRAYLSTAFGCPYVGKIKAKATLQSIEKLVALGVDEISIGDTIGVADPRSIENVIRPVLKNFKKIRFALHCHDTRGTALVNSFKAYELGIRIFDSSAGGLGGCPYAPGASGNLATEDLVYLMEKMGISTGIDVDVLSEASIWLSHIINKNIPSKVVQAYLHSGKKNKKWL